MNFQLPDYLRWYYSCPNILLGDFGYDSIESLKTKEIQVECNHIIDLVVCLLIYQFNQFQVYFYFKPVKDNFVVYYIGKNESNDQENHCKPHDLVCESSPVSPYASYFYGESSLQSNSNQKDKVFRRSLKRYKRDVALANLQVM